MGIEIQVAITEHLANEAEAVAMDAAGGQPDQFVANADGVAIEQFRFFDDADGKARQVIILGGVHVGHDRRFAPQERTIGLDTPVADPADDLFEPIGVVLPHRDVIEKKERFGAGAEEVVDAHRHQIDTDGSVATGRLGDL